VRLILLSIVQGLAIKGSELRVPRVIQTEF
jgi:hypothetical protein